MAIPADGAPDWVRLVQGGFAGDLDKRHRLLMQVVAATEQQYWGYVRGIAGGIDREPGLEPALWPHWAADRTVRLARDLLALAGLTAAQEETVMGHVQYVVDAILGRDSRPDQAGIDDS